MPRHTALPVLAVRVSGNRLVNAEDATVRLVGVNRSGTEFLCEGRRIFDGPTGSASIAAMKSWHINSVRIPLNEDCWLGINGLSPASSGPAYRAAIEAYVARLNAAGLYVILDVHWSAAGTELALAHQDMLDASHGYTLWRSIATAFRRRPAVLFDLYNEPHNVGGATRTNEEWSCWLHGCGEYAGMGGLVSAVRSTGARNVILVAGVDWASDDSKWLQYEPKDRLHQLAATFHVYYDDSACTALSCWNKTLLPVAARVPVVNDEFGELQCGDPPAIAWLDQWMSYARTHGFSMLAWAWDVWQVGCPGGPVLITNNGGSPTSFGAAVKAFYGRPNPLR
jgi:endoglucanase